ncbi:DegV family protein [Specibacter sp. RAF43]|uniref:DegV family protein n=1 Tax=Specibacter sp. RAF43 TaxID=3233057 RepID=UPI003F99E6BB
MATESTPVRGWLRHQVGRLRPRPAPPGAVPPPRPRIAVVSDSAAALPPEWLAANNGAGRLTIVPMPVIIGEDVYADDDAELETHISLALAAGSPVRTSRPSPGQFEAAYRAAAAAGCESIVSIHISAKLSGTLDAARMAAARVPVPVQVLDSETVGMALGLGVQAAVAAARAGAGAEQVVAAAQSAVRSGTVFFYVPSLEQLRRGGRISLASSWVGTMLDIKPILGIRDGAVVPLERVRTAGKAVARLEKLAAAEVSARTSGTAQACLHYFGNEAQAKDLGAALQADCPGLGAFTLTRLPAVLAAHAGLGVLVVVVADAFTPPHPGPAAG